ncbi:MAG: class I SAM-dependent methyltransferase [Myxococcota bacterium]|nr:class I SAM-dependent methyltransferase [Myxococcota bacterium]
MNKASLVSAMIVGLLVCIDCGHIKGFMYSGINRDRWQETEKVMSVLGIKKGQHVADIGAGAGYFTYHFSEAVGPEGQVYAVDVDSVMVDLLRKKTEDKGVNNVTVIQGKYEESNLPRSSIDLVFLCNVYHEMSNHVSYFKNLKPAFREKGRLAIIDLKPQGKFGCSGAHGTEKGKIVSEISRAGYTLDKEYNFLEEQNFQVFAVDK